MSLSSSRLLAPGPHARARGSLRLRVVVRARRHRARGVLPGAVPGRPERRLPRGRAVGRRRRPRRARPRAGVVGVAVADAPHRGGGGGHLRHGVPTLVGRRARRGPRPARAGGGRPPALAAGGGAGGGRGRAAPRVRGGQLRPLRVALQRAAAPAGLLHLRQGPRGCARRQPREPLRAEVRPHHRRPLPVAARGGTPAAVPLPHLGTEGPRHRVGHLRHRRPRQLPADRCPAPRRARRWSGCGGPWCGTGAGPGGWSGPRPPSPPRPPWPSATWPSATWSTSCRSWSCWPPPACGSSPGGRPPGPGGARGAWRPAWSCSGRSASGARPRWPSRPGPSRSSPTTRSCSGSPASSTRSTTTSSVGGPPTCAP